MSIINIKIVQIWATISTPLLKIFSFSTLSRSAWLSPVYEISSHSNLCKPNRISETISVVTSVATRLNLFNLTQFLQIAKNPSFWTPVPPIKSSSMSFKYRPMELTPLDLIGFLQYQHTITLRYVMFLFSNSNGLLYRLISMLNCCRKRKVTINLKKDGNF